MAKNFADDMPPSTGSVLSGEAGLVQRVRGVVRRAFADDVPHIVVGYSGGRDSLALLLVLVELRRLGLCRLTAVHVDHAMRPDSADCAREAQAIAESLGVSCLLYTAPKHPTKLFLGVGDEEAARRFRYQSFHRALSEVDGHAVAVGHHRQDQAETMLLHMMRGTGLSGLKGMAVDDTLPVSWWDFQKDRPIVLLQVLRPLLREDPSLLDAIVRDSGVPVVDDPSNDDPAYRRNRIRHELLPLLENISPGAMSRLVSLSDIVREDDAALDDVASRLLERAIEDDALGWETFRGAPLGFQRRVIRNWIFQHRGPGDLSHDRVDAVIAMAERGHGGKSVEIGGGWRVGYEKGVLHLTAPGKC